MGSEMCIRDSHISTREGFCDISQLLVDSGCKINVRNRSGETPLHSIVRGGNAAHVNLLLRNNANANIQDTFGYTPLHISTLQGLCDISQLLVDSGCKINVENDDGETPLHSAVGGNNVAHVNLLLRNNADANIQDTFGYTPLEISSRRGFSRISQLLIDSGCNKNLKNREGKTPLDLERYPYFPLYSPYRGDSEEAKGSEGRAYASQMRFRHKSFFESEAKGDPSVSPPTLCLPSSPSPPSPPLLGKVESCFESEDKGDALVIRPTLPILSLPSSRKSRSGLLSKNRPDLSSALSKRRKVDVSRPTLYDDLEEDKGNKGYASQKGFRHKSFVESEGKGDAWMNKPTRSTLSSPLLGKLRSGLLLKKRSESSSAVKKRLIARDSLPSLYGDLEEDKGNKGYESQKSFRHQIVIESEDEDEDDALINPETVSSPIVGKGKEQSST